MSNLTNKMKKILTSLLVLFSLTVNSQVIDWDNFDSEIADKVLLVEMNKFRDSLGLSTFVYSQSLHDNLSTYTTDQMVKERKTFHPNKNHLLEMTNREMKKELISKLNLKLAEWKIKLFGPYEVCVESFITIAGDGGRRYQHKTYSELGKNLIKHWCTSKPHYKTLTDPFGDMSSGQKTLFSVGSASIQTGKCGYTGDDSIYATFQMYKVYEY